MIFRVYLKEVGVHNGILGRKYFVRKFLSSLILAFLVSLRHECKQWNFIHILSTRFISYLKKTMNASVSALVCNLGCINAKLYAQNWTDPYFFKIRCSKSFYDDFPHLRRFDNHNRHFGCFFFLSLLSSPPHPTTHNEGFSRVLYNINAYLFLYTGNNWNVMKIINHLRQCFFFVNSNFWSMSLEFKQVIWECGAKQEYN